MKKETKAEALTLKNHQLKLLSEIIDIPLHSEKARARNRFGKILFEKIDTIEKERVALCEKYGKYNNDRKAYDIDLKNIEKFNKEYGKLMSEVCIIDLLPSVKADLPVIKDILDKTKRGFNYTEMEVYDELVAEFGKV